MSHQPLKIGFQGTPFSYSEIAANRLIEEYHLNDTILVPLESSQNVADKLRAGEIDYGVVALQNTIGGDVKETEEAFLTNEWITNCKVIIDINHCLFVKNTSLSNKDIQSVASHEQALRQCKNSIQRILGEVQLIEETDTAICAQLLIDGLLPETCAVICSREAGEAKNLHLVEAGMQDHKNNRTEFALLSVSDLSNTRESPLSRRFTGWLFAENVFVLFQKLGVTVLVLSSFLLASLSDSMFPTIFKVSLPQALISMSGLAFAFIVGTSHFRRRYSLGLICGYWIYMDKIIRGAKDPNQSYSIPRVVRIRRHGSKLQLRGWICEKPSRPYFQSNEVFYDDFMSQSGSLLYKYRSNIHQGIANFDGVVVLEWSKAEGSHQINNLYGRYLGFMTDTQGVLNFKRISIEKFREHRSISDNDE